MSEKLIYDFVTLFVVLDPVGMLAIFLAISENLAPNERRKTALLGVLYAFGILLFFIVAGELLLIQMGIPLRAFQIAGGVLLLLYGIEMAIGANPPGVGQTGARADGGNLHALAVYPLAVPAIAGPGAMLTAVLLTDNRLFGFSDQVLTSAALGTVLALFLMTLLAANPIIRLIGTGGANVLRRVMGILLTAIAVKMVLGAIQNWLKLPPL
ncbi:MAG: MarC family protein [Thiohalocapsa sp.]